MRRYDRWIDGEAGPVVRPYALTGGRTDPAGNAVLDLIAVIVASGPSPGPAELAKLSPEHRKLLSLCQAPATVADVAADVALPLGVVRVLLADLIQQAKISVLPRRAAARPRTSTDLDVLKEVLDGLRAL
jgi:Protein of unknown function (DUF742)